MTLRLAAAALAGLCALAAPAASADDGPLKLGLILDMSSLYSDITGTGSATAAKMAAEDFGGKVLGRPIEILLPRPLREAHVELRSHYMRQPERRLMAGRSLGTGVACRGVECSG